VIKVQRNNLHENGWSASGELHVDDLVARVRAAKAKGYRHIIAAGQSYGGAISLEAGTRSADLFAVIAFAPGHGSDACGSSAGMSSRDIAANLPGYLAQAIGKLRTPRIVLSVADGDECMGHQRPSERLEAALKASPATYVHFDETMPIQGHFAALTPQFNAWYRDCLLDFLSPERAPGGKRTVCPPPINAKYMLPPDLALRPGSARPQALRDFVGLWSGRINESGRELCLAVETIAEGKLKGVAYFGVDGGKRPEMANTKLSAEREDDHFVHHGAENYRFAITPLLAEAAVAIAISSRSGKNSYGAKLRPGC
jgi:hypothetical protein